jgi:hypothetical protein
VGLNKLVLVWEQNKGMVEEFDDVCSTGRDPTVSVARVLAGWKQVEI